MAVPNTGKLAGRTLFITGASRGIGKHIAVKCAKDGANVVVAAKTGEPHPKLPGTIYTAAQEIEDAGGKALPLVVDIQNEETVKQAVDTAVKKFGGIDILVNNASAIHLTGTEATPMKRYDLMMNINTRGTYMCSKYCVPHLLKGVNPHILNLSPPLNMKPMWFKNHVAYTMAKYGMSMCVLGMSEEFKSQIGVNALWPRTGIYTAAMDMLGGGEGVKAQCRTPDIMSDAAYAILTRDAKTTGGNFYIDDEVVQAEGVTDLKQYAYDPDHPLLADFFLETAGDDLGANIAAAGGKPRFSAGKDSSAEGTNSVGGPQQTFDNIKAVINEDLVKSTGGVFLFNIQDIGEWHIDLKNGSGSVGQGPPTGSADCTMSMNLENFQNMFAGKLDATSAFMSGKLKIKGNMMLAMRLEKLMKQLNAKN